MRRLAANLYSKDTRFVFELIQNADDTKYSIAYAGSEAPSLCFSLYQDRIVVDSNEDGFSPEDIWAICRINASTKTNVRGYIGEKGIGFKSVFKVAKKVHVQSEPYSFAFEYEHDKNDDGLGMVTPMNEDHLDVPNGVRTRIILHLLSSCDRAALCKEFLDLPDTLLLFLRKLKRLSIRMSLPDLHESEHQYSLHSSANRVTIDKTVGSISSSSSSRHYWITRRWVTGMPADPARKKINGAEVVLAFPLDADDVPIIEENHIFAYLPLRKVGYKVSIAHRLPTS